VIVNIILSKAILIESSRRDLFIDIPADRFTYKNNQITLLSCFTFIPETGMELFKTGISFT